MSSQDEKSQFSQRLKQALQDDQHPISPTYLANEFNHRYNNSPISVQAANNWLNGKAIPNQDKLAILSIWLNKSAQWLRFGDMTQAQSPIAQSSPDELNYFLKFKRLKHTQQALVQDLIDEFLSQS